MQSYVKGQKHLFNITDYFFNIKGIFMRLSNDNIQEMLFDNAISRQLDSEEIIFSNQLPFGEIFIQSKKVGNHQLINWKSKFSEEIKISGEMVTSSLRIYFLNRITKGMNVGFEKGFRQNVKQGSANVLFCNENHQGFTLFDRNGETEIDTLVISNEHFKQLSLQYPEVFESLYERYQREKIFMLFPDFSPISFEVNTIFQQIANSYLMGTSAMAYTDLKVLELLVLLLKISEQTKNEIGKYCKTLSDIDKIREAANILISNINETPSLIELAHQVGLNEKKLKYGFKEVFGTTVFGYLYDYKMQLVKQLLLDTNKTISEIALLCGYDYVSHFSTAFKRKWGVSPISCKQRK